MNVIFLLLVTTGMGRINENIHCCSAFIVMNIDYLKDLNESQRTAVLYNDGPSLVIAGAGSGKTRVLTYKIAHLLENDYEPWNILALTFTNKAAREMKDRIAQQVGEQRARYLWMGTFHSIFSRILRAEAGHIGFPSQFTIYDTADSNSLLNAIIKEMGLDEKNYKASTVQACISNAKNHLISSSQYAVDREIQQYDITTKRPAIRDIYRIYQARCQQAGAMDFDDLLMYTHILFKEHPEVLAHYRNQFRYVLVDEYQDTNYAQHSIVLQLTQENQRVCVVGDDAQSIYSFRGANINNILHFTKTYHNAKVFKLEQNYRSTQVIVRAANSLIEKNEFQIRKEVFSEKEKGEPIGVFQAYSDVEEGEIVANKIAELRRRKDYEYSDYAILYRTNAQSRIFEEALRKRGILYKIYGGLSFYQRKEIKDVISYFRLIVNSNDEEAFKRIINYPTRGIGATTVGKITEAAANKGVSLWTVLCEPLSYGLNINKGTHAKLQNFYKLIESFIAKQENKNAYELGVEVICQTGIMNDVSQDNSPENMSRRENIEELMNGMKDFCTLHLEEGNTNVSLADFLSEVSLLTELDSNEEEDNKKITLMTIHSAKGLEFKNVFVVGMEENLFPGARALTSPQALEEERRLFYVAITRAEEHCFLTYSKSRFRYGKMEFANPSRFLSDIETCYLKFPHEADISNSVDERANNFRRKVDLMHSISSSHLPFENDNSRQRLSKVQVIPSTAPRNLKKINMNDSTSSTATSIEKVVSGQTIEHERFGFGEVVKVEGVGDNAKATIHFKNAGIKQLLLRFARFKVIE